MKNQKNKQNTATSPNVFKSFCPEITERIMRSKKGRIFRLSLARKSGTTVCFPAKFIKSTDRSLIMTNMKSYEKVIIPFSTIDHVLIG